MKNKFIIFGVVLLLTFGLVSATQAIPKDKTMGKEARAVLMLAEEGNMNQVRGEAIPTLYDEAEVELFGRKELRGEGRIALHDGKSINFESNGTKVRIRSNGSFADCDNCNLTSENGKLHARLSNGRHAEIKVMPNQASERALERLRLKNCPEGNCTIELKEVGSRNGTRMAYEVKTKKKAKFLGIFNSEMDVETQIDAETGEVLKTRRPWWSFMASEEDETEEVEAE